MIYSRMAGALEENPAVVSGPEESQTLVLGFSTALYFRVLMLMGFKLLKVRYELRKLVFSRLGAGAKWEEARER